MCYGSCGKSIILSLNKQFQVQFAIVTTMIGSAIYGATFNLVTRVVVP